LSGALDAFELSAHLPHDQWTTNLRFQFALSRHRFPEAMAILREALEIDPYSPWIHARLAWALHLSGRAEESLEQINRTIQLFPTHEGSVFYGGIILSYNGEAERALQMAAGVIHRISYFDMATATHAYGLARAGRKEEARSILERLQWLSRERFVLSSFTPIVHAVLGEFDAAIHDLRTAMRDGCPWFFQMLADPRLKPLYGHPEFEQMRAILPRLEAALVEETALPVGA
jgi:tetratricopeptide (TPR) repeat protein